MEYDKRSQALRAIAKTNNKEIFGRGRKVRAEEADFDNQKKRRRSIECKFCKLKGHFVGDCPKLYARKSEKMKMEDMRR